MDLATLFGLLLAWGAVLFSMFHASEGAMGSYFKPNEIFLVLGGSVGAAMLSMPLHNITGVVSFLKKWILNKDSHVDHLIKEMVQYAETARRDGVLALESVARESAGSVSSPRAFQLTIDGTDPEIIERILRIEIDAMVERHKHGKHFFHTMAKFGPGFGLMATLIAQVAMFRHLDGDAAVIGKAARHCADRNTLWLHPAKFDCRAGCRKIGAAISGGNLRHGDHHAGCSEHPGRQQPPSRGNAAIELPEQYAARRNAQSRIMVHEKHKGTRRRKRIPSFPVFEFFV